MANISNEDLKNILFPKEVKEFLESHPGCYPRAAKMYAKESINCEVKHWKRTLFQIHERTAQTEDLIDRNPRLFSN